MIRTFAASLLAFTVFSTVPPVTAQSQSANPCPSSRKALERTISGLTLIKTSPDMAGGFAHYDTTNMRVLGVRPEKFIAYFTGGKFLSLEIILPGQNAASYVKPFRTALAGPGILQCDAQSCSWKSQKDVVNAAKDELTRVDLSSTIFKTARIDCSYR